jgi:hypothetical protein
VAPAFDMREFAPPREAMFTLRNGETYKVSGDPDVNDVALLLRIEDEIQDKEAGELAVALDEGKATLVALIQACEPDRDLTDFRIGPEEMLLVFAYICHGPSVAAAVAAGVSQINARDEDEPHEVAEVDDPIPLERRSSGRSSGSEHDDVGHLATGTG